ncbi:lytic transglycosylase domain-containing protein [Xanthomonas euvesicatoria]|uniref:lytic transglycosylase domain-containing protein n=1 Tax=Xanthomonas euvesicatoria TaxID=456327 RepID=UPI003D2F6C59
MLPGIEVMACGDMSAPLSVMQHVVQVESSHNPYAIGVVGGRLVRQPQNLGEALSTVQMLQEKGYNFSIGLAQVNRYNLSKYGLVSYEQAFQQCPNLKAGSAILSECYQRSGKDWGKALSCYYSGNFVTGFRHGYVQKVFDSMARANAQPGVAPIPLASQGQAKGRQPLKTTKAILQTLPDRVASRVIDENYHNASVAPQRDAALVFPQRTDNLEAESSRSRQRDLKGAFPPAQRTLGTSAQSIGARSSPAERAPYVSQAATGLAREEEVAVLMSSQAPVILGASAKQVPASQPVPSSPSSQQQLVKQGDAAFVF